MSVQTKQADFVKLYAGMKPNTVRTKDDFVRPSPPDCLDQIIKAANAGRISENIWMPHELIDDLLLGTPIIGKTTEMGNNEIHLSILRREHFNCVSVPGDIDEYR